MTVETTSPPAEDRTAQPSGIAACGRLPRWAPWAVLVAAAAVASTIVPPTARTTLKSPRASIPKATAGIWLWSRLVEGGRRATDRFVTCVVTAAFGIAMVPLVSLVVEVVRRGVERLDATFFTNSMVGIIGEGGGAYHAIMGTLIVTGLTALMSVPIGLLTAIYLVEYGRGKLQRAITFFVDVMTGIPSIVAGLFAYALFAIFFGPGVRMGFAGAVALSVLMIPVVVRSSEEVLKLVPNELREASLALGVPKWRTIVKVVLPTAIAGLGTAVTLAIARVVGETAPLLITLGITNATNTNPFDGRMATLPVYAYYQLTQPGVPPQPAIDRAWTAALVLIILVMGLNLVARLISRFFAPRTSR